MLTQKGIDIMPAMYVRDPETGKFIPVGGGGGSAIDDTTPSTVTVYSGKKTQDEIDRLNEQINEQKEANATQDEEIAKKLNASELPTAINTALAQAKESGQFDGKDGEQGEDGQAATLEIVGATSLPYGSAPTVTEQSGSTAQNRKYSIGIPEGKPGENGEGGGSGGSVNGNTVILMDMTIEEDVSGVEQLLPKEIIDRARNEGFRTFTVACKLVATKDESVTTNGGMNLGLGLQGVGHVAAWNPMSNVADGWSDVTPAFGSTKTPYAYASIIIGGKPGQYLADKEGEWNNPQRGISAAFAEKATSGKHIKFLETSTIALNDKTAIDFHTNTVFGAGSWFFASIEF